MTPCLMEKEWEDLKERIEKSKMFLDRASNQFPIMEHVLLVHMLENQICTMSLLLKMEEERKNDLNIQQA